MPVSPGHYDQPQLRGADLCEYVVLRVATEKSSFAVQAFKDRIEYISVDICYIHINITHTDNAV